MPDYRTLEDPASSTATNEVHEITRAFSLHLQGGSV